MKNKHTPGPWTFDGNFVEAITGDTICQFFSREDEDFSNKVPNGKLIAAAPQMYYALQKVLAFRRGEGIYDFQKIPLGRRDNEYHDKWQEIENEIQAAIKTANNETN